MTQFSGLTSGILFQNAIACSDDSSSRMATAEDGYCGGWLLQRTSISEDGYCRGRLFPRIVGYYRGWLMRRMVSGDDGYRRGWPLSRSLRAHCVLSKSRPQTDLMYQGRTQTRKCRVLPHLVGPHYEASIRYTYRCREDDMLELFIQRAIQT